MDRIETAMQHIFVDICKSYINKEDACVLYLEYYATKLDYSSILTSVKEMDFKCKLTDNFLTIKLK